MDFLARYATGKFIKEFVPNLFSKHTKKHHPEIVTKQMERVATNHIDGLTTGMLAMTHRKDRAKVLENTDCPVLIILGKEDTAVPLEIGLNQCSLPAISDVHILETGHMAMLEEPATAVDLVRSFSQKVW